MNLVRALKLFCVGQEETLTVESAKEWREWSDECRVRTKNECPGGAGREQGDSHDTIGGDQSLPSSCSHESSGRPTSFSSSACNHAPRCFCMTGKHALPAIAQTLLGCRQVLAPGFDRHRSPCNRLLNALRPHRSPERLTTPQVS